MYMYIYIDIDICCISFVVSNSERLTKPRATSAFSERLELQAVSLLMDASASVDPLDRGSEINHWDLTVYNVIIYIYTYLVNKGNHPQMALIQVSEIL